MWKLFYADRTTFSSDDGPWLDAPPFGVMGVAYVDDKVGYSRDSGDFYINPDGQPWAADHWGVLDLLLKKGVLQPWEQLTALPAETLVGAGVKFGRSVDNQTWQELKSWMDTDLELPRKSASYAHERP